MGDEIAGDGLPGGDLPGISPARPEPPRPDAASVRPGPHVPEPDAVDEAYWRMIEVQDITIAQTVRLARQAIRAERHLSASPEWPTIRDGLRDAIEMLGPRAESDPAAARRLAVVRRLLRGERA